MNSPALAEQIRASGMMVDADFGTAQAAEIFLSLIWCKRRRKNKPLDG
jgi:hypothetical protein